MEFADLKAELDKGGVRRMYLFHGEERAVMQKYIQRIALMVSEGVRLKSSSIKEVYPYLQSKGLFQHHKTLIVDNPKDLDGVDSDMLYKAIGKNTLILVFDTVDLRRGFFKENKNLMVEFKPFTPQQLTYLVTRALGVDDRLAAGIAAFCGGSVARIENECHKLSHLGRPVTEADVEELITPPVEDQIFAMVAAVLGKKPAVAWQLYQDLLELKESPIKIVSLLYTGFRNAMMVQSYYSLSNSDIAAKTGLTFFQVEKAREAVGSFSIDRLLQILRQVQNTEVGMKSGRVDIQVGMDWLLLSILR